MDGYSVTEAASILGVPTERVWELLARGILSGTPEGEAGMRVFLQPRPAPTPPVLEARPPNGDGGSREPERELSPFRELLTEFRNLTERYGQALLALGESRGEVAALRSRVDLLEARMDLRLPMSPSPQAAPASAPGWPTPVASAAPAAEPAAEAHDEAVRADREPHPEDARPEKEEHPRRRRAHRRATESFAEALARAEDPTRPELPGATETAAAMAALRDEAGHDVEAVLPRELPAAEPMPMPEEPRDVAAESVGAEAATAEPEAENSEAMEPVVAEAVPEPAIAEAVEQEPVEPALEPEPVAAGAVGPAPAEVRAVDPAEVEPQEPIRDAAETQSPSPIAAVPAPPDDEAPTEDREAEPIAFDPERYTVEIIEPDWYADEETSGVPSEAPRPDAADAAAEAPVADTGTGAEPAGAARAEPPAWPNEEPAADASTDPTEAADEELVLRVGAEPEASEPAGATEPGARMDEGADEIEVVGAAPPRPEPAPLPGSTELDDALEALDAVSRPSSDPNQGVTDDEWPPASGAQAPASVPDARSGATDNPVARQPGLLPSVRPQTTSASRAYRRLRRIFPG